MASDMVMGTAKNIDISCDINGNRIDFIVCAPQTGCGV